MWNLTIVREYAMSYTSKKNLVCPEELMGQVTQVTQVSNHTDPLLYR